MGCSETKGTGIEHPVLYCPPEKWPALTDKYTPTGTTHEAYGIKIYEAGHGNRALVIFGDLYGI